MMIHIPCRDLMHQQQDRGRRMHRVAGLAPIYEKHQSVRVAINLH